MIDVGEGYRLLTADDVRMEGDERYWESDERWTPLFGDVGLSYKRDIGHLGNVYRRKIAEPPPIPLTDESAVERVNELRKLGRLEWKCTYERGGFWRFENRLKPTASHYRTAQDKPITAEQVAQARELGIELEAIPESGGSATPITRPDGFVPPTPVQRVVK